LQDGEKGPLSKTRTRMFEIRSLARMANDRQLVLIDF